MSGLANLARQFALFALVGALGFLVDAGVTVGLVQSGWSPRAARLPGLGLAIVFTWLANGRFAFRDRDGGGAAGLLRYVSVSLAGAALNYGVYAIVVAPLGSILIAVAFATGISMFANFAGYRALVFSARRAR